MVWGLFLPFMFNDLSRAFPLRLLNGKTGHAEPGMADGKRAASARWCPILINGSRACSKDS